MGVSSGGAAKVSSPLPSAPPGIRLARHHFRGQWKPASDDFSPSFPSAHLSSEGQEEDVDQSPSSEKEGASSESLNCPKVKCVLVGDGAIGKTSLIVSYTTNGYPTEYVPTAFDNYAVVVTVDGKPVQLQLCDTAGQDDFDSLRPLCYPSTDVFLVCFSVVNPTSFHNVLDKWIPELRRHCPRAPVILVGTQCDLRSDVKVLVELDQYEERPVTEEQALARTRNISALSYVECSALTQKNLKEVFDAAILAAMDKQGLLEKVKRKGSFKVKCKSGLWGSSATPAENKPKKRWKKFFCMS